MVYFYTPWKYQFSEGIETGQWHEMGQITGTLLNILQIECMHLCIIIIITKVIFLM